MATAWILRHLLRRLQQFIIFASPDYTSRSCWHYNLTCVIGLSIYAQKRLSFLVINFRSFDCVIYKSDAIEIAYKPILCEKHNNWNIICTVADRIKNIWTRQPCDCISIFFTFTHFIGPSRLNATKYDMKTACFSNQNEFSRKDLDQVLTRQNFMTFLW